MAKMLLNLRHVPEDEADDVRAFLDANGIAWYETTPGLFGISLGAIWIKHDSDFPEARRLMSDYQEGRTWKLRAETFGSLLRERPGWVIVRIIGIIALLVLMALPGYLLWR